MGRVAARVGDYGRSQALGHSVHPLCPTVSRCRRLGSHDHTHPADVSAQQLCFAASLQPYIHDAWHDHGLLRRHTRAVRVGKLPRAVDDRRSGHGLSTPECLQFLADGVRGISSLLQFPWRKRALWRRKCTRCGLVGLRSVDVACLLARTPLSAAQIMLCVDRDLGGHFFDTQAGGSATLWMHFFWIFGHPEVYILVIPAFAFASEIIPVFSRKPIFGYPVMVAATVCIGFISMSVWA